ncbi:MULTISPECIES: phage tail tube protein [Halomonas]|uniref:Major tail protein n=1 Tax=Halomonas halophila TaxID=29573 RepID=A0ABQ0TZK4_9GAMM|nr:MULTISPECIES: hypothetical protein [Halomonas]MDR5889633.1 hypothetical protein [Halomonas salina]WJY06315.1 hypothetical protein QWG60_11415 [Halomonas halophila]GEK71598.1 hypothetical protein HHA04nite_01420 [Halomonas halophila]
MAKDANIVIPAGRVYFNPKKTDGSGDYEGLRYFAQTTGFAITASSENLTVDDSDGAIAERIRDIPIRVTRSGRMTGRDISPDNVALFIVGGVSDVTQDGTPVADEAIAVQPGRFYQLGASAANPGGVRNVSAVDVQDETDTTTYVEGSDYVVHAEIGLLEILEGGTISEETLHVDYTPASETRSRVASHNDAPREGELRFFADNTDGDASDVFIPAVRLTPDGELALKGRDNPVEMAFAISVQKRDGFEQVYVDGRAAG